MKLHKIIFVVCLTASIGLLVAGFLVPPKGIIDGSVLTGVGELFGFATLGTLIAIAKDKNVKLTHGNTEISVSENEEEDV